MREVCGAAAAGRKARAWPQCGLEGGGRVSAEGAALLGSAAPGSQRRAERRLVRYEKGRPNNSRRTQTHEADRNDASHPAARRCAFARAWAARLLCASFRALKGDGRPAPGSAHPAPPSALDSTLDATLDTALDQASHTRTHGQQQRRDASRPCAPPSRPQSAGRPRSPPLEAEGRRSKAEGRRPQRSAEA